MVQTDVLDIEAPLSSDHALQSDASHTKHNIRVAKVEDPAMQQMSCHGSGAFGSSGGNSSSSSSSSVSFEPFVLPAVLLPLRAFCLGATVPFLLLAFTGGGALAGGVFTGAGVCFANDAVGTVGTVVSGFATALRLGATVCKKLSVSSKKQSVEDATREQRHRLMQKARIAGWCRSICPTKRQKRDRKEVQRKFGWSMSTFSWDLNTTFCGHKT